MSTWTAMLLQLVSATLLRYGISSLGFRSIAVVVVVVSG